MKRKKRPGYGIQEVLSILRSHADPKGVEGMARFGIISRKALGVSAPVIRNLGRSIGSNHKLALQLWKTGILEARGLAALVGDPKKVTRKLMEEWVRDFDNWAVCDGVCGNLFDKTPYAFKTAVQWTKRKEEFVRRAGFVMMAEIAVHNKEAHDRTFLRFFPIIKKGAVDPRNFVKKAVNWALRQIGKRNLRLNTAAIKTAKQIRKLDASSAKWVASDALRELQSPEVQKRLRKKKLA